MAPKKANKADLDALISDLQKENNRGTPFVQWVAFGISSLLTSASPIILYLTPIFDLKISKNFPHVAVCCLLTTVLLTIAYNIVANKKRSFLFSSREYNPLKSLKGEEKESQEKSLQISTVTESGLFALFSVNLIFYVLFLAFAFSVIARLSLPPTASFGLSTVIPALSLLVFAKFVY